MPTTEAPSTERILEQALKLFSTKGYDATSVREICEGAGITKPTLYHFFGSKEGVYRALVDGALEDMRRRIVEQVSEPGRAEDRLRRVARGYFEAARGRRDLARFFFSLIHNPPDTAPATDFNHFYEEIVALVAQVVEDGIKRSELTPGPTQVRMLVFMGSLGEALCGYLLNGRPDLTPALADAIVDTVLRGWTPNRTRPA
jgi:TetR/AcrR family transcriptional regulator